MKRATSRKITATALAALLNLVLLAGAASGGNVTIKLATVAPEGTSWVNVLKEAVTEVRSKTAGRVNFRVYPGGIAGDEPDVIKKMRVGQYQGAVFTGVGMGEILPESRIVELPYLYRNVAEIDYVQGRFTPALEQKFRARNFEFIAWMEPGLVYLMSQKPIRKPADLQGVKMWVWEGDPLADAMIKAYRIAPVPIALPDVLMALQTGMINTVYAPPLAALALQWHTRVKYFLDEPLTNSTGAVLISRDAWARISPADQLTVKETIRAHLARLTRITRRQNQESIEKFRQMGIRIEKLDPRSHEEMSAIAASMRPKLVGRIYSVEQLGQIEGYLAEFRGKNARGAARTGKP